MIRTSFMNRAALSYFLLTLLVIGCNNDDTYSKFIEGQISEVLPNGVVVDCSDEVNKGVSGKINSIGYNCFIQFKDDTKFIDDKGEILTKNDYTRSQTVKVTLDTPENIRRWHSTEASKRSVIKASSIVLVPSKR
ncbi:MULTISPECIES: hypothetical protein [unclassified Paenibacillus]|uniref:hypothetical protein n=1 Tax=unclassified Paenibacillus TaxID=185978 RepID=UPI002781BAC1|nr:MULTISPECIES: hypothetical protein [unclassified Paenibacillus]MDQ0896188.1 hypothetical protein [Paenibacillus sp. V4I7]MDQ0913996.1 hypothetical protein [Paenibacillus sp. V4I5]